MYHTLRAMSKKPSVLNQITAGIVGYIGHKCDIEAPHT